VRVWYFPLAQQGESLLLPFGRCQDLLRQFAPEADKRSLAVLPHHFDQTAQRLRI